MSSFETWTILRKFKINKMVSIFRKIFKVAFLKNPTFFLVHFFVDKLVLILQRIPVSFMLLNHFSFLEGFLRISKENIKVV